MDFIEYPYFTLPVGALSGLIGVFFYWPILVLFGICILLAFHRSGAVKGKGVVTQVSAYVLLFLATTLTMYGAGKVLDRGTRDYLREVTNAIVEKIKPLPSIPLLISTYKIPLLVVEKPVTVEIHFRNTSDTTIHAKIFSAVGVGDTTNDLDILKHNCDLTFSTAKDYASKKSGEIDSEVPPHADMHVNILGKPVTKEQLPALLAGTKSIYFAGFFDYTFDGVKHETPFNGFTDEQHHIPNCQDHNAPY